MSVILFGKDEVYQDMADAYEGLKHFLLAPYQDEQDTEFYTALRRLYFANVASWLCTYHDDTPLSVKELEGIDTFDLDCGKKRCDANYIADLHKFTQAWSRLNYNLVTNGGEAYRPVKSWELVQSLIERLTCYVLEYVTEGVR
jgi:hypothetical protein